MEFMDWIEIPRVDNIKLTRQIFDTIQNQLVTQTLDGAICLTSHHLIFSSKSNKKDEEIWILHSMIDALEFKVQKDIRNQLVVKCKNFQIFLIDFLNTNVCLSINKSLDLLSNLTSENMKFPFFNQFNGSNVKKENEINYWDSNPVEDYFNSCFGSGALSNKDSLSSEWRITNINKDFTICSTYPKLNIVPKNVDDSVIKASSQFRAGGRFPVLSYYHKATKSFVMRSSQPLLGSSNKRSKEDESLLKMALPMGKQGYIYDLRDSSLLKSAASKGGGYETEANYPLWKRINRHMEKFDQLQVSFSKLIDACLGDSNNSMDRYLNKLESSNWLLNIRQALYLSSCIADELHNKNSCILIHGWDGIDNTLVVTSLVQILLNSECRTLKGFQNLIEREWLQAGHPFSKRCFKSAYGISQSKQEGPIFLLFLDCVKQLLEQFPVSFEFNEDLLIILFDNTMAPQYGTFLGNCQKEREQLCVSARTISLWSYVNSEEIIKTVINPIYEFKNGVLWPSLYTQCLVLWSSLYLRYQTNENPSKEKKNEIEKLVQLNKKSRLNIEKLKNELNELQNEARKRETFIQEAELKNI